VKTADSPATISKSESRLGFALRRRQLLKSFAWATAGVAVSPLLLNSRLLGSSFGAESSQGVDTDTVQFPSGTFTVGAYLARPKAAGKYPAVLVVHDERGLQDDIRAVVRQVALAGFIAIAPNLLSRNGGVDKQTRPAEALHQLSVDGSIQDLNSAFAFMQKHPSVSSGKISAIGLGWGGWRTFAFAANQPELGKGVVFCGTAPEDGLSDIQAMFLAHYAQLDFRVTGNLPWTEKTLKVAGKQFTSYVYDNVDHGFYDPSTPEYNAAAANLAWSRTLQFLKSSE
jgi:carboxymethylenebutenolidase